MVATHWQTRFVEKSRAEPNTARKHEAVNVHNAIDNPNLLTRDGNNPSD